VSQSPEPRRYAVYRVGTVYAVTAFLVAQLIGKFSGALHLDENTADLIIITIALGFVPTVMITWMFAALPAGIAKKRYTERLKHALAMAKRFSAVPDEQADTYSDKYQRRQRDGNLP
jgi:hypothetical protein